MVLLEAYKTNLMIINISVNWHYWRRKWQPTPVLSPGKSHGQRSLADCSLWDITESRHNWVQAWYWHHSRICSQRLFSHCRNEYEANILLSLGQAQHLRTPSSKNWLKTIQDLNHSVSEFFINQGLLA